MSGLSKLKSIDPTVLQAKVIKWLAGIGLVLLILLGVYMLGRYDGKQGCLSAMKTVAAKMADQRAGNAIDATTRFGDYIVKDRALEEGITGALTQVRDHYANKAPKQVIVEKTKLVPVPGSKELVYVPNDSCSSNFLDADELRLYNLGNKRSDLDASNP